MTDDELAMIAEQGEMLRSNPSIAMQEVGGSIIRLVAEMRAIRTGDWINLAADEIAGDPRAHADADVIADMIRDHIEAAGRRRSG